MLKKGRYLLSTLDAFPLLKDPRGNPLPEIALAGRSNVGKSSLINHLLSQQGLAKTSSTPGKTQLLNFYSIGDEWILVDLPGYGFAKAPPSAVAAWSKAIDTYLNTSTSLKLVLLLTDSRREITEEELSLIEWARHRKIPLCVIVTKMDKLKKAERDVKVEQVKQITQAEVLGFSVKEPFPRVLLTKRIEQIL